MDTNKFKVGDRVTCTKNYDKERTMYKIKGLEATIVVEPSIRGLRYGLEFDEYIDGHSCDLHGKRGYCWWVPEKYIEFCDEDIKDEIEIDDLWSLIL